jgi:hypothetical protein
VRVRHQGRIDWTKGGHGAYACWTDFELLVMTEGVWGLGASQRKGGMVEIAEGRKEGLKRSG